MKLLIKTFSAIMAISAMMISTSCSEENDKLKMTDVSLSIDIDIDLPEFTMEEGSFTLRNVNSGIETTVALDNSSTTVIEGLYNITFIGTGSYMSNGVSTEIKIQGTLQNASVTSATGNLSVPAFIQNASAGFVIAEIFGVGTYTPDNKQYNGDQYVRIVNNSDELLYADGLVFMESKFTTTSKYDYTPDIMNEAIAVQAVVVVPGNGNDVPVEPGESLILCDNAINHKEANINSIDLSNADFEWYTESTSSSNPDIDNPAIPNLDMYYNYTLSIWILNKQGNRVYAIGRIPADVSKEDYLRDYAYEYTYTMVTGATSSTQRCYKFPNKWIIDAVTLSPANSYEWNLTVPAIDMGHTYFGVNNTVSENIGKAVVRKVAYTVDGRDILQDTNNSSIDFIPSTQPTLMD